MNLNDWGYKWGLPAEAIEELKQLLIEPTQAATLEAIGSEAGAQQRIRLAAPRRGSILWRNNVGMLYDSNGVPVRFGLANDSSKVNKMTKSSDLIGITPISYAGRTFGVFTAIECKKPGWKYKGTDREKAQLNYLNIVRSFGGIGTFATGDEDYNNAIDQYVR